MIAHESLLVSERAARDEVQIPGRAAEKQILIVDDNDYIVTALNICSRKTAISRLRAIAVRKHLNPWEKKY